MEDLKGKKATIRKEMLGILRSQAPEERAARSRKIQETLLASEDFRGSRTIMTYVAMPAEVDTTMIIEKALEEGKRVAVPFISAVDKTMAAAELSSLTDLIQGPYGVHQPKTGSSKTVPLREIDLIIVPAVAYDKTNKRLGRGRGYFDDFLALRDLSTAKTIGLAFSFQIIDRVPAASHDIPVSRVITD